MSSKDQPPPNFKQFQQRRASDGFEEAAPRREAAAAWRAFVGKRGQRLEGLFRSTDIMANPRYGPAPATAVLLLRDILAQLGLALPAIPDVQILEWMVSPEARRLGWREVAAGMAQAAANDGRPAIVLAADPLTCPLAGVIFPDEAGTATNPTVMMVTEELPLFPGTVLQGFRGQGVRYFALGG